MYQFRWESPAFEGAFKATHSLEVPFVFDNVGHHPAFVGQGDGLAKLASDMSGAWIAFARSGAPSVPTSFALS